MYNNKPSTSKLSFFDPDSPEATFSSRSFGYSFDEHANSLLNKLNDIYLSQTDPSCNVSIEVNGLHLMRAHSIVLAICSEYFESALDSIVKPKANITFDLNTKIIPITKSTLIEVINYMYTGVILISPDVLRTARVLRCKPLEKFVGGKLEEAKKSASSDKTGSTYGTINEVS